MGWRLQPCALEAATLCAGGCSCVCCGLLPCVLWATVVCVVGWSIRVSIHLAFLAPMLGSVMGGPQMPGSSIEARMHCADLGKLGE